MKAPKEALYGDVLWAACQHIINDPLYKPPHPELISQIEFDCDALYTVWKIIDDILKQKTQEEKEIEKWQKLNPAQA